MRKVYLLFLILFGLAQIVFGQNTWVNELHYRNTGSDANEFIEIALQDAASYDVTSLRITIYKASNGTVETAITLDQLLPAGSVTNNISLYTWSLGLGNSVGICIDYSGTVIQFLSYGGSFTASAGVANGLTATDIGLVESGNTPAGSSLGLTGSGTQYSDFSWTTYTLTATPGNENTSQALPVELTSFTASVANKGVMLNWSTATEVNNYGFEIERSVADSWEKIGFVEGHGNSYSPKEYSYYDSTPLNGEVKYRLKQLDTDGAFEYHEEATVNVKALGKVVLNQNHPNPFNPSTAISFLLPEVTYVKVVVYNAIGQQVAELANGEMDAGNHSVDFDGSTLSSGMYFYRLETASYSKTMKMMLIK